MFFLIYGTNFEKREKARDQIIKILKNKKIDMDSMLSVPKINKENYTLLPNYFGGASLFGERILVNMDDLLTKEETREYIYKHLNDLMNSDNIFIADEPFALSASFQKLERELKKENLDQNVFDASENKSVKDVDPFPLCDFIENRDKKGAWLEFKNIYLEWEDSEAQAVHGALWWKWKMLWSAYLDGDRYKFYSLYRLKNKDIMYSKKELETFGKELSLMAMKANNGEVNLMRSIEKFILKI